MGETPNPVSRILFLDSSSLIPVPCFPIQGKGFGNQGATARNLFLEESP